MIRRARFLPPGEGRRQGQGRRRLQGPAGIADFTPHCGRHTWATWHYIANRDLKKLQGLGGWKTLSIALRYVHTNVDEHMGSIDALPWAGTREVRNVIPLVF